MSRAVWIIAVAAGLLAGPAWASEVVEVRVGNHPTFTRVVFELDAPAGYGIERRTVEQGASEILVTLEASSKPRSVKSGSVMVERVAVQDGRARSVAHIRLKKSPSRVKELILSDPPRIVFDLVFPEKELMAAKRAAERKAQAEAEKKKTEAAELPKLATAPKPAPKTSAAPTASKPAPKSAAAPEAPKPAPKTAAAPEAPKPAPKTSAAPEAPKPAPKASAVPEAPKPRPELASTQKPSPPRSAVPEPSTVLKAPPPELPKQVAPPEPEKPKALAKAEPPKPSVEPLPPKAEPRKAAARKTAAAPAPAAGEGIDWVMWGSVAAGILVVLLAIVLVARRRSLPNDLDVTALAEEEGDEGGLLDGGFAMGEATAPESTDAKAEPAPEQPIAPDTQIPEEEPPRSTPDIAAGPGLFDDEPEKENETMDIESTDMPMERSASELPTQMGAGAAAAGAVGESDIARLVQDLERRVAQLETRLDESVDARERLERQVAAQSEELRVQRAAIARTQRALRSLNRGEEEQATEPALREPSS